MACNLDRFLGEPADLDAKWIADVQNLSKFEACYNSDKIASMQTTFFVTYTTRLWWPFCALLDDTLNSMFFLALIVPITYIGMMAVVFIGFIQSVPVTRMYLLPHEYIAIYKVTVETLFDL